MYELFQTIANTHELESVFRELKLLTIENMTDEQYIATAWLAFTTGDQVTLKQTLLHRPDEQIKDNSLRANMLALRAVALFGGSISKSEELIEEALKLVASSKDDILKGNVYMSYARIQASKIDLKLAATYYEKAGICFEKSKGSFLAVMAYTNQNLNLYAVSDVEQVRESCEYHLRLSAGRYWDIMNFPLALTYFYEKKYAYASKLLEKTKATIDELNYPHMHGAVEYYLLLCHLHNNHINSAKNLIETFENQIAHMEHFISYQFLNCMKTEYALKNKLRVDMNVYEQLISKAEELVEKGFVYSLLTAVHYLIESEGEAKLIDRLFEKYENFSETVYPDVRTQMKRLHKKWTNTKAEVNYLSELTDREKEIFFDLTKGMSNQCIADKQFITLGTVKWHLNNIYSKLGVSNRFEAINLYQTIKSKLNSDEAL